MVVVDQSERLDHAQAIGEKGETMEGEQIRTKRWPRIARTAGIWIFGLAAGAGVGDVIGTAVKYGYDNETGPGVLAGMCAFACFRLWMGERNG